MNRRALIIAIVVFTSLVLSAAAFGMLIGGQNGVKRPAAGEFGPAAKHTSKGLYVVRLIDADTLKPRRMYTLQLAIVDAQNKTIDNATITVDGGMPEHGHGLPTKPRVTKALGAGAYQIEGLRFNMGGWWELKLNITTPAGTDDVTFNLAL